MHRTLFRALFATLLGGTLAAGQPPRFSEHILRKLHNETVTGYALQERTLVTWGDRLLWGRLPQGNYQVVRGRGRAFAEGGCLLDVDGDGKLDIVVNEGGPESGLVSRTAFGRPLDAPCHRHRHRRAGHAARYPVRPSRGPADPQANASALLRDSRRSHRALALPGCLFLLFALAPGRPAHGGYRWRRAAGHPGGHVLDPLA